MFAYRIKRYFFFIYSYRVLSDNVTCPAGYYDEPESNKMRQVVRKRSERQLVKNDGSKKTSPENKKGAG